MLINFEQSLVAGLDTLFMPLHREKEDAATTKGRTMDKDRVKGSAQQVKGKVKEVAGKVTGDAKLEGEGKAEKTGGKIRNAIGGLKDTLRGK
jgi:uncharacterized protein YjbJ (UPF0337 family)